LNATGFLPRALVHISLPKEFVTDERMINDLLSEEIHEGATAPSMKSTSLREFIVTEVPEDAQAEIPLRTAKSITQFCDDRNIDDMVPIHIHPEGEGAEKSATFASKVASKKTPALSINWASIMEECSEIQVIDLKEVMAMQSLLQALKQGVRGTEAGGLLLPSNLAEVLPLLTQLLIRNAKQADLKVIYDQTGKVEMPYKDAFSLDESKQTATLKAVLALKEDTIKLALADLTSIISGLDKIPTVDDITTPGPGKTGHVFIAMLLVGIYYEVNYDQPSAKVRPVVSHIDAVRKLLVHRFDSLFPTSKDMGERILRLVEIVFRKTMLKLTSKEVKWGNSTKLAEAIVPLCFEVTTAGRELWIDISRIISIKKMVEEPLPPNARKGQKPEMKPKFTKAHALPRCGVDRCPLTPAENMAFKVVNAALDSSHLFLTGFTQKERKSPDAPKMLKEYEVAQRSLYAATDMINQSLSGRKITIRDKATALQSSLPAVQQKLTADGRQMVSPENWRTAGNTYILEKQEECEKITVQQLKAVGFDIKSLADVNEKMCVSCIKTRIQAALKEADLLELA
jgi:hypothetical protein